MHRSRWRAAALAAAAVALSASVSSQQTTTAATPGASLITEAFARLDAGQLEEAKATFDRALAIARDERLPRLEAHAFRGLGRYWAQKGDTAAARESLDRAMKLFEDLGDQAGIGQVWNQRGSNGLFRQDLREAETGFRQAAAAFERAGFPGEQANALRNLTFIPTLGTEERLQLIEAAVDRAVAAKQPGLHGLALHNWGDLLVLAGDFAGAMKRLEEARAILETAGTPASRARVYTSLGRTYRLHGEPALALPYYQRALELQRAAGDPPGEVQTLNAMALANSILGRPKDAQGLYERALALAQAKGAPGQASFIRRQLGIFLSDHAQPARAVALLEPEIETAAAIGDRVPALASLTKAYVALKRYAEAESTASEAVRLATPSSNLESRRTAHFARAVAIRAAGRPADAVADTREVLKLVEQARPNLVQTDALRLGFGERMRSYFDFAVSLFTSLGQPDEAFLATEQGRARAFLDLLASQDVQVTSKAPSLDALKAIASRLQSTVISYWVTAEETLAFVVQPDGRIDSHAIAAPASRLEALVGATANGLASATGGSLTRGPDGSLPAGSAASQDRLVLGERALMVWRELYDLLILPIRRWIPAADGQLLTIVPDGTLGRLSFAALRNERGRYLIEGYRLHYVSALSLLDFTGRNPAARAASARTLVIANPALARDGATASLASLPGAIREAEAIAGRVKTPAIDVLSGRDATEARVRAEAPARAVLHFAAHGIVNDDRPMESFLALARGTAEPSNDGALTAREIYALDLQASLVVLSACRSAGGRVTGDGIVGLTRAFMSAGVPSVVASAWDLPDETAPWIFERFYAARDRHLTAGAALRTAQLELLKALRAGTFAIETGAGRFVVPEHPAVWAGLQLWGEP